MVMVDPPGPSLQTYVETRFNLLTKLMDERFKETDLRYQQRFEAGQKGLDAALAAADRAVTKAELATEKRFESVNEFRGTLDNQQRTLIPRSEVDVMVKGLEGKIADITKQLDAMQAEKKGITGGWGYAVGAVGLVMTLISLVFVVVKAFKP